MTSLPSTSLVAIDCASPEATLKALQLSLRDLKVDEAVLFTDRPIAAEGIRVVQIPTLAQPVDRARFIFKELIGHVATDRVLMVGWDGFVIEPKRWSSSFQEYDYVGLGGFWLGSRALLTALGDARFDPLAPEHQAITLAYRGELEGDFNLFLADPATTTRFAAGREPQPGVSFGFYGLAALAALLPPEFVSELLSLISGADARRSDLLGLLLDRFRLGDLATARALALRLSLEYGVDALAERLAALAPTSAVARAVLLSTLAA
jgi:hypothetical protein